MRAGRRKTLTRAEQVTTFGLRRRQWDQTTVRARDTTAVSQTFTRAEPENGMVSIPNGKFDGRVRTRCGRVATPHGCERGRMTATAIDRAGVGLTSVTRIAVSGGSEPGHRY